MKIEYHVVAGGVASAALIPVLGVNSAAFFTASVLIDVDHYLDYVYRNNFTDFSIKRMFAFHDLLDEKISETPFVGLSVMHTVEFFLLVYAVAALTGLAAIEAILWGLLFHMVLDLVYLYRQGILFRRALSIVEYVIRWNRLERQGLQPDLPYHLAFRAMSTESEPLEANEEREVAQENQQVAKEQYQNNLGE
jgi:hypothetical protein